MQNLSSQALSTDTLNPKKEDISNLSANFQFDIEFEIICSLDNLPVKKSYLSIDELALTAISNESGKIILRNIPSGRYTVDVISVGFIASTLVLEGAGQGFQSIRVEMISNIN